MGNELLQRTKNNSLHRTGIRNITRPNGFDQLLREPSKGGEGSTSDALRWGTKDAPRWGTNDARSTSSWENCITQVNKRRQ